MARMKKGEKRQLNAFDNMTESFIYLCQNLSYALNLFWLPMLITFGVSFLFLCVDRYLYQLTTENTKGIVYAAMYYVPLYIGGCIYHVAWQRKVLNVEVEKRRAHFRLRWRELEFFVISIILYFIFILPSFLFEFFDYSTEAWLKVVLVVCCVISVFVFSRLIMLLPIASLTDNIPLFAMVCWSFGVTKGNAIKLYLSVLLISCVAGIPLKIVQLILGSVEGGLFWRLTETLVLTYSAVFAMSVVSAFICFSFSELRIDGD